MLERKVNSILKVWIRGYMLRLKVLCSIAQPKVFILFLLNYHFILVYIKVPNGFYFIRSTQTAFILYKIFLKV